MHKIKRAILKQLGKSEEKSSTEIAQALGITTHNVNYHLNTLAAKGLVNRREISPRYIMWSLSKKVSEELPEEESGAG